MTNDPMFFLNFVIEFMIMFAIFINLLLLIASSFKIKDYSIDIVLLGMISFCVLMGLTEFTELTIESYKMANAEVPITTELVSEMFTLMASMLIFGVALTKNKLQKFHLGSRK